MSTRPSKRLLSVMKAANRLHVALYRKSRGKFAGRIANMPLLVITTYGRITGKPTTNAVVFIQDGKDYMVSATAGGSDWVPGWYLNLKVRQDAKIEVGGEALNVQATIIRGEERTQQYEKFKSASDNFTKYEKSTSRELPVIRLTPIQAG